MKTEELARIFKALSDPNRLAILQMLREECGGTCRFEPGENGNTVSEIAKCCDIGLSTVSHHIKELKNAGLIECVKRGQWVYCSPRPEVLAQIREFVQA
jgi:ArsR family transcriptional regulator